MEIIKGYTAEVKFPVPADLTEVTATVTAGTENYTPVETTVTNGVAVVSVPYAAVLDEHELVIALAFEYQGRTHTQTKKAQVVAPLLEKWEIEAIIEDEPVETWDIERAVRNVINAHTGQTFGHFRGTKVAVANGEHALALPARLIRLESFGVENNPYPLFDRTRFPVGRPELFAGHNLFAISGDGWYIKAVRSPDLGIKNDHSDFVMSGDGVIRAPRLYRGPFAKDTRFAITGEWGWEEVPEPVREAAKLLVNDYATMDSTYRDRYLESLTSPDWRIQFHSGAFRHTGNVRADQLLAQFVLKRGWAVI